MATVAMEIERCLADVTTPLKVAIMGCVVNGPGEAKLADVGFAGVKEGKASLYIRGKRIRTLSTDEAVVLIEESARKLVKERYKFR